MSAKRKTMMRLIEDIGLIMFAITNSIAGASLWGFEPFFTISLWILSVVCVVRGIADLMEVFSTRDNAKQE